MTFRLAIVIAIVIAAAGSRTVAAQSGPGTASAEPFKVGTFEIRGVPTVGLVLRDSLIVDLPAANAALERSPMYPKLPMAMDMLDLIGRYEYGIKARLYEIVNDLTRNNRLTAKPRPDYIHDLAAVRTLPPIMYPGKIMNAAVNFYSHVNETGTPEQIAAARRQRREQRGVPYLFLKPSRGAVIGHGDSVVLPYGRDRIDWEVELSTVIGRAAKNVSAKDAQNYIFGYMISLDISDRGGRPPGGAPFTTDWLVGKGHDTFAPMGPWIVPKEFYGDPMQKLRQTLSVDGTKMQEARAGDMIHSLYELIEYASSIITLFPGDVVNNGTSGGVGMGTAVRGEQRFLKPGEVIEASIDDIGTLRIPVVAGETPGPGTGARLPPVSSYRK
jgi:2-keto-4-pentenoate hydratase/2-oxohepta-3-ene-1,7-dioic acid hydratase in catechol pathway